MLRLAPNLEVAQTERLRLHDHGARLQRQRHAESSNKLLVLIDGRSVYTPLASGVFWENAMSRWPISSASKWSADRAAPVGRQCRQWRDQYRHQGRVRHAGRRCSTPRAGTTDDKIMARYGFTPWTAGRCASMARSAMPTTPARAGARPGAHGLGPQPGRLPPGPGIWRSDSLTLQGDIYRQLHARRWKSRQGRGYNLTARWNHELRRAARRLRSAGLSRREHPHPAAGWRASSSTPPTCRCQHNTSAVAGTTPSSGARSTAFQGSLSIPLSIFTFANPVTASRCRRICSSRIAFRSATM